MLEKFVVRLLNTDCLQKHAIFTQCGFNTLKHFDYTTVLCHETIVQSLIDGAKDTALQKCFNQAIEFTKVRY